MKPYVLFLLCTVAICGCNKYETQFEGPYNDANNDQTIQQPHEILYVQGGNIYLLTRNFNDRKVLSGTPPNVQKASINFAHDLIACAAPGQDIVVLDSSGVQQATVANSSDAEWFDWHPNDKTLVILKGGILSFYGPSVEVADTDLNDVFPFPSFEKKVQSASVMADGTVLFTYRYYDGLNYYQSARMRYPASFFSSDNIYDVGAFPAIEGVRGTQNDRLYIINAPDNISPVAYYFDLNNGSGLYQFGYFSYFAYSPDGFQGVYFDGLDLVNYFNQDFRYALGGSAITALDW